MRWIDRFNFPAWDNFGWCAVIALWLLFEMWGATHHNAATFTYYVRNSVKPIIRLVAWLVLGWHFLWYDATWWKTFVQWCWHWPAMK